MRTHICYVIGQELQRYGYAATHEEPINYYSNMPVVLPAKNRAANTTFTGKYASFADMKYDIIDFDTRSVHYYQVRGDAGCVRPSNAVAPCKDSLVSACSKAPFIRYPTYTRYGKYDVPDVAQGTMASAAEIVTDSVVLVPLKTDIGDDADTAKLRWNWYLKQLNQDAVRVQDWDTDGEALFESEVGRMSVAPPEGLQSTMVTQTRDYADQLLLCRYMINAQRWLFMLVTHEQAKSYVDKNRLSLANGRFDKHGVFHEYEMDITVPQVDEDRIIIKHAQGEDTFPLLDETGQERTIYWACYENADVRIELRKPRELQLLGMDAVTLNSVWLHPNVTGVRLIGCHICNLYINSRLCTPEAMMLTNARLENIYFTNTVDSIQRCTELGAIRVAYDVTDTVSADIGVIHIDASVSCILAGAFEPLCVDVGLTRVHIAKRGLLYAGTMAFVQCDIDRVPMTLTYAEFAAFYEVRLHGSLQVNAVNLMIGCYMDCILSDSKDAHLQRTRWQGTQRGIILYSDTRGFWFSYMEHPTTAYEWYMMHRWLPGRYGEQYLMYINGFVLAVIPVLH